MENAFGYEVEQGGITLKPHSLYVCVAGGSDIDIARTIWQKKPPGCDMNGDTVVSVEDDQNGYLPPLPTYQISFQRAKPLTVSIQVMLSSASGKPLDAQAQVQRAVLRSFEGQDGSLRVRLGSSIYASRFYPGIIALGAWANVLEIKVSRDGQNFVDVVTAHIDEIPTTSQEEIMVNFQ